MQKLINEIVTDLIKVDPEFAGMEKDLRKLVQKFLAAKPEAKIDAVFKKRLQNELRARAAELKIKRGSDSKKPFNLFPMQKLAYSR